MTPFFRGPGIYGGEGSHTTHEGKKFLWPKELMGHVWGGGSCRGGWYVPWHASAGPFPCARRVDRSMQFIPNNRVTVASNLVLAELAASSLVGGGGRTIEIRSHAIPQIPLA